MNDDNRVTKMPLDAVGLQLASHQTPGSVRLQDAMYRQVLLKSPQVNAIVQAAVQRWDTALPSELWPGRTLLLSSCPEPCLSSCWRPTLQPEKLRAVMS